MTECNHINAGRRGLLIAGALSATAVAVPGVAGAAEAASQAGKNVLQQRRSFKLINWKY